MRILFLTETLPYPLDSGGRIKTWQTLGMLGTRHEVHLHAFIRHEHERQYDEVLRQRCRSARLHLVGRSVLREAADLLASAVSRQPFTVRRHWRPAVARQIVSASRRLAPHVVYCDHLSTLQYGLPLGRPVFHDAHNVEYRLVQRFAAGHRGQWRGALASREWKALKRYEASVYPQCSLISAVSQEDAAAIRELAGGAVPVTVIPIGFDTTRICPCPGLPAEPRVLFVGGLHWPPNEEGVRWFADRVWPRIRQDRPDATCHVVGRVTEAQRRVLARVGLVLTGYLEDLAPEWHAARVFVVPLRSGGGMRVKLLEAFAYGVPVVSTRVGAEGIDVEHGRHALLAESPEDFAEATLALLVDAQRAASLAAAGQALVQARYGLATVAAHLHAAIDAVAASALSTPGASPQTPTPLKS